MPYRPYPNADRAPLGEAEALTFNDAFEKRSNYMRAEGFHLMVDGKDRVPLPGCPGCGTPAESVFWGVQDATLLVNVDPCGHRFVVEPITDERWLGPA